ncbi:MAG: sigma-70 family RNA polymerase sigma factor [Planctomycetota bacterium]
MPTQPLENAPATADPARWVGEHGDALFRFALGRVRREDLAEDLVQETFLSALRSREEFAGVSTEKTWLIGILKHKIADHHRRRFRERPAEVAADRWLDGCFDDTGHLQPSPATWTNPAAAWEEAEFWATLLQCVGKLPESLAAVFSLRMLDDLSSDEVCTTLDISTSHFHVMMHRARMRLWKCLGVHWFGDERGES